MNVKLSIVLTFASITALMNDQATGQIAVCDFKYTSFDSHAYLSSKRNGLYSCILNTEQLTYGEVVTTIQGNHQSDHFDINVKYLTLKNFNKLMTFSSIFCNSFPTLEAIIINDASIQIIDADSLSNCGNLELLGKRINAV